MRRGALLVLVAVCVAAPAAAVDLSLFGTYQDFRDADSGIGMGVRAGFGGDRFGFDLGLSYLDSEINLGSGPVACSCDVSNLRVAPLDLGARWTIFREGTWRPYIGAGVNVLFVESDNVSVDDEVGWYAVGGALVGDGKKNELMIEVIYRSSDANIDFIDQGFATNDPPALDLSGLGFSIGAVWRF